MNTPQADDTVTTPSGPAGDESATARRSPAPGRLSITGRMFAVVAFIEAFTWGGLLVGMFLKYVTVSTEAGVWLFGRLHGGSFMIYVAVTVVAAISLRWRWWVTLTALLAAIPPLVTIPVERWLQRTGRLSRPPS